MEWLKEVTVAKTKGVAGIGRKLPTTKVNLPTGEINPAYTSWVNMLNRCTRSDRYKGYNSTVCEEWLIYENFMFWFYQQDWNGKELDKVILGDGTLYSPSTCCMVSKRINNFLTKTGGYPYGNKVVRGGEVVYRTLVRNPVNNKREFLGNFKTIDEAHKTWKSRKHEIAQELSKEVSDPRVRDALKRRFE